MADIGLPLLLLVNWKGLDQRNTRHLILVIMSVGIFESLYGMFEFFSHHRHILNLHREDLVSAVTGTFFNHNYLAGYLLMAIPLSVAYLYSSKVVQENRFMGWRAQLSALDAKTLLIGFGIIVTVLGLLFSSSRMGAASLLLSFSLVSFFFRSPEKRHGISKLPALLFGLAMLWAAWIGLDAVISRFFTASEDLDSRWRIWANTLQIVKDFPLLGSGLGTFGQVFPVYRSFHIRGLVSHAENDFLQLASEVGLIGIGVLLVLFVILFLKAISGVRSLDPGDPQRYFRVAGIMGIIALMFHSLVERNLQIPANAFLYTLIWAFVLKPSKRKPVINDRSENWIGEIDRVSRLSANSFSLPS